MPVTNHSKSKNLHLENRLKLKFLEWFLQNIFIFWLLLLKYKNNSICWKDSTRRLQDVKHYLADGTLKCVVKPFRQLYVSCGDLGSTSDKINVVPLIYVLLMNKKESIYKTLFSLIKSQIPDWNPISFRTDYE